VGILDTQNRTPKGQTLPSAFVTGGSGFVGRALIRALRARGIEVRALARSTAAITAVQRAGATPIAGDVLDRAAMTAGMEGCELVVHAAAKVDDWGPLAAFHEVNVRGTETVLGAARAARVRRLVHVSSEAVLVGCGPLVDVDERARPASRLAGPYSVTTAEAEARVLAANASGTPGASGHALERVVVRPRFIWGRGDTVLLPRFVEAVESGRFAWFDGGRYRTSTCHVRNVVEGILAAFDRGRAGEIYFLTDGEPWTFRHFLTALLATQGVAPKERTVPFWLAHNGVRAVEATYQTLRLRAPPPLTHGALHLMGAEVTVRDDKARAELGYASHVTREQGLAELREDASA
jgi:nucleoside-diphosphate-sugar epimerase